MKRFILGLLTSLLLVFAAPVNALPPFDYPTESYAPFDLHRLVNLKSYDHLYTGDEREIVSLSCPHPSGYYFEAYYSGYSQPSGSVKALYRLYNPKLQKHFYTTNTNEKTFAESQGFKYEGIDINVQTVQQTDYEFPMYRLYNPHNGDHLYTYNDSEIDKAHSYGYKDEGIAWYMAQGDNTWTVRMYNPQRQDHFYASEAEWKDVGCKEQRYKDEGVVFSGYGCSVPDQYCDQDSLNPGHNHILGRYYNNRTGIHLFTTNRYDAPYPEWQYEKRWWYSDPSKGSSINAQDVYRLRYPPTGAYVLTVSVDEKNAAITSGWVYEGIAFKAEPPCNCSW